MNWKFKKSALIKAALACIITAQAALAYGKEPDASSSAEKGQLWLTTGFFSHHFKRHNNYNEQNTGLGIEYSFSQSTALAVGHYKNSVHKPSTYLHFIYTPLQLGPLWLGGAVGLLDGYPALRDGRFSPVVLPVGTSSFKLFNHDVGINLTYIPTISRQVDGAVAIQFKLRIN